jgi:Stress responsive A/B Barrel Domain
VFAHIVLYRLSPAAGSTGRKRLEDLIGSLARLPGVLELEAGSNAAPREFTHGYDWGFCMRFADRDARDAYLEHPAHVRVAHEVARLVDDLAVLGIDGTSAPD